ncbi:phosphomethylpyrimidine synthase ThiC [Candidatus Omnitrophota bacterium]
MTQLEFARKKKYSPQIRLISQREGIPARTIRERVAKGEIVIPANNKRRISRPCAIGKGLTTKVNANIGTSSHRPNLNRELKKLETVIKYGADTVMDLSIGGDLKKIRTEIIRRCPLPVGTVPIYEATVNAKKKCGSFLKMDTGDMFDVLHEQAKQGVDFFTIHSGVTKKNLSYLQNKSPRITGIVSRGGAILACWMKKHNRENPFFQYFDRVLDIAREYDITLSLGDGLRPGSIFDANDNAQNAELATLGKLTKRAREKSVQVMIEGPGHVRINKIKENVQLQKKLCSEAPFYVLGPLVTDIGSGYDHITSAIGGALAASYGADFLCFVTPAEHLRLPSIEDVKQGVIASRIAAHSGNLVKGIPSALRWDKEMSTARGKRNWKKQIKLSLDPEKSIRYYGSTKQRSGEVCTMCGEYCAIKLSDISSKGLTSRDTARGNQLMRV